MIEDSEGVFGGHEALGGLARWTEIGPREVSEEEHGFVRVSCRKPLQKVRVLYRKRRVIAHFRLLAQHARYCLFPGTGMLSVGHDYFVNVDGQDERRSVNVTVKAIVVRY